MQTTREKQPSVKEEKPKVDLQLRAPATKPPSFYQHLLDVDSHPVPPIMREQSPLKGGVTEVPTTVYTSKAFHDLEVEKVWKRVWQMACREEHIPEVGDTYLYEVATLKFIIVRSAPDTIKAFPNACRHRGRKLVDHPGRRQSLRCPYHGWNWNLDGTLDRVTAAWDFPQVSDPEEWGLREMKVGTWGGFVFINPDPNAESLESFLGDMPRHYVRAPLEDRYVAAHAAKVIPTNWKIAQEAFMEAYHVMGTHPQLCAQAATTDNQYDAFGNYARAMTPNFVPGAMMAREVSEQEMVDMLLDRRPGEKRLVEVPPGKTAREHMADMARDSARKFIGDKADTFSDAEMVDSLFFNVFPNLSPWGAFNQICFRFRPNGDSPDTCIQDTYMLRPFIGQRPPPAKTTLLGIDDDWTKAPEIGLFLARILNQDVSNMKPMMEGMRASFEKTVQFSNYQETKIRHFHTLLQEWIEKP